MKNVPLILPMTISSLMRERLRAPHRNHYDNARQRGAEAARDSGGLLKGDPRIAKKLPTHQESVRPDSPRSPKKTFCTSSWNEKPSLYLFHSAPPLFMKEIAQKESHKITQFTGGMAEAQSTHYKVRQHLMDTVWLLMFLPLS